MNAAKGSLTIIADNIVGGRNELLGEHGFAVYLETDNGKFIFDTGSGKTLVHNAIVCNKDLKAVNKIILSHGHADHTGGLPNLLAFQSQIKVFAHPDIFLNRFRKTNSAEKYAGIPYTKGYLERMGANFVFNREYVEIEENVFLTGEVPRENEWERGDIDNRFSIRNGKVTPEIVLDDQSLVIRTEKGILIVSGCAHSGIINVINHAIRITGIDSIFGIVGGTHLAFSGVFQMEKTIEALRTFKIFHLIPAHCTGLKAAIRLQKEFGEMVEFSNVGYTLAF